MAAEDPAIKAERLKLEILPWFGSKGIGVKAMEEYKKDPDMKWTMKKYHLAILKSGPHPPRPFLFCNVNPFGRVCGVGV